MKVSETFRADFDLVCTSAQTTPAEIKIMRDLVRQDYPAAREAFTGTARMLREIAGVGYA